jgi:hypothetical protein
MTELGIAGKVVVAIDEELQTASSHLRPFDSLAPVSFMLQLGGMLKAQVASLQTSALAR